MNWDQLRYFSLVAEMGSVSRAAQVANVSHATVLRAIKRLETELQLRLFDHARTGYQLTQDGWDIRLNVDVIGQEVQSIIQKAKSRDDQLHGQINLILPDATMVDLLPRVGRFLREHSEVHVKTRQGVALSPDDFVKNEVDVVFLVTNNPPEMLVGRKLSNISFVLAHNPTKEVKNAPWVTWDSAAELMSIQSEAQRLLSSRRIALQVHEYNAALIAVRDGIGTTLVSHHSLDDDIVEIKTARKPQEFGLWMLTHPEYRYIARISAFMRFMTESFAEPEG